MIFGKVIRSPYPHAKIINIDVSKAKKLTGVRAIVTGKDAPEEKVGVIRDRNVLAWEVVRFVGEAVAAVAADTIELAEKAAELVEVEYEVLPAVFEPEEAMKPNPPAVIHPYISQYSIAPQVNPVYRGDPELPNVYSHRKVRRGDVGKSFSEADWVVENRFSIPRIHHCSLERHVAVAEPKLDGGLTMWDSTHLTYAHKSDLCRLFNLPPSKVRVIVPYVGGNFGGKSGVTIAAIAALLAFKSWRPVKLVLERDEVFVDGLSREPVIIYIKDGFRSDGRILAREIRIILNAGAYSGGMARLNRRAVFAAVGTYKIPHLKLDSYAVATNEPPAGAYRGFGTPEVIWAIESQMDMVAEKLGIDPVQIRKSNLLKEGEEDSLGMITHSIGAEECLEKVAHWIHWGSESNVVQGEWKSGKGIALANKFTVSGTTAVVEAKLHPDGTVEIRHSANELGQGCNTVLAQIAAEEFATSVNKIWIVYSDTAITPFDEGTISSRTTHHVGNAVLLACRDLKRQVLNRVSKVIGVSPNEMDITDGSIIFRRKKIPLKLTELFAATEYGVKDGEMIGVGKYTGPTAYEDPETGQSRRPVAYYAHGANAAEVEVNMETGEVKVLRIACCFDMGQPINPKICEGQMEGGVGMGIGNTLFEEMVLEEGVVINPNFKDYKLPSSLDVPTMNDVKSMIAAVPHREGPFGAKGFSEGALVAIAPAIANAVYRATGVRIHDLPITREKILKALLRKESK